MRLVLTMANCYSTSAMHNADIFNFVMGHNAALWCIQSPLSLLCYIFSSVCDRNENILFVDNVFAFSRPGIGITLIYMGVEAILFFAVTLLVEVCEIERKGEVLICQLDKTFSISTSVAQRSFFLPEIRRLLRRRPTEITLVDESGAVRWLVYGSLPNATSDKVIYNYIYIYNYRQSWSICIINMNVQC